MKKNDKKYILLLIVITLFLGTCLFTSIFKYREGVDKSEWITPGYDNKDGYYNEHKTSGIPEIDAIEFNHHYKPPAYIDSNKNPTIYPLTPNQAPLSAPATLPVSQPSSISQGPVMTRKKLIRKKRKM